MNGDIENLLAVSYDASDCSVLVFKEWWYKKPTMAELGRMVKQFNVSSGDEVYSDWTEDSFIIAIPNDQHGKTYIEELYKAIKRMDIKMFFLITGLCFIIASSVPKMYQGKQ